VHDPFICVQQASPGSSQLVAGSCSQNPAVITKPGMQAGPVAQTGSPSSPHGAQTPTTHWFQASQVKPSQQISPAAPQAQLWQTPSRLHRPGWQVVVPHAGWPSPPQAAQKPSTHWFQASQAPPLQHN
jgi:hypothetical protein